MLTPTITQQVQINLNRTDTNIVGTGQTITAQIQLWCNEAKRKVEQDFSMDYMVKNVTSTFTSAAQTLAISTLVDVHFFKDIFAVVYRQKTAANVANEDLSWTDLPKISWREKLQVESYVSPGVIYTGPPQGWLMDGTNFIISPTPASGFTYDVQIFFWQFSTDWTFGVGEEPYLAMYAPYCVIAWATKLGYDWLGEGDSKKWEAEYRAKLHEFRVNEAQRSLGGEYMLQPLTGSADHQVSRRIGTRWWVSGLGRI